MPQLSGQAQENTEDAHCKVLCGFTCTAMERTRGDGMETSDLDGLDVEVASETSGPRSMALSGCIIPPLLPQPLERSNATMDCLKSTESN